MGGTSSPSADRSQVEHRSTVIDVMMSGLELPGFRLDRVFGQHAVGGLKPRRWLSSGLLLSRSKPTDANNP